MKAYIPAIPKHLTKAVLASLLVAPSLYAATWTGTSGFWEDDTNWDSAGYFPGGPGSPAGESANRIPGINGGSMIVNLNADLSTGNPIGDIRIDGNAASGTTTLNVNAGAVLNATSASNILLTINEGGTADGSTALTSVNVAGSLTVGQIRLARDSGTASLNISSGGSLNMTGGGHFEIRTDKTDSVGIFSMTGGSFTSGGNRELRMGAFDSQLNFSGTADFDGSALTLLTASGQVGSKDTISVVGSGITDLTFKAVEAYTLATNTGGSTTFSFTADSSGVAAIVSLGAIDLDGNGTTDGASNLDVDVSAYTGSADLVLFDYTGGSLDGTFGAVDTGGFGIIDYAYNGGTQIALIVPEPSTSLLTLGALSLGLARRRRR